MKMVPASKAGVWTEVFGTAASFYSDVVAIAQSYGYTTDVELGDLMRDSERTGSDAKTVADATLQEVAESARRWMNDHVMPMGYYMVIHRDCFEMRYFGDDFEARRMEGGGYELRRIPKYDLIPQEYTLTSLIRGEQDG